MSFLPPPAPGTGPYPGPRPVAHDPLAVALGNASLLGIGYLMMRRWKTAVANWLVTATLVVLVLALRELWCELAIAGLCVLVIVHGWFLAKAQPWQAAVRRRRLIAVGVTVPILLVVGLLRFDAARIDGSVTEAREAGDCGRVTAAEQRYWFGHGIADAPKTARGEADVDACNRLDTGREQLRTALSGDLEELAFGFRILDSVLREPGQEQTVGVALDEFLAALPKNDPCANVTIAGWLRTRTPNHTALDRSSAVVPRIEPAALVACADKHAKSSDWKAARTLYQQTLDRYPSDRLVARATAGVRNADLSLQLANVRNLIGAGEGYCSTPARYSAATPYHRGVNRTLFLGDADDYTAKLPSSWKTTDPTVASLVVCADEPDYGTAVRTCPYTPVKNPDTFPTDVTFHKIAIPLKAYELRTGRLVARTTLQIDGSSCPRTLHYTSYFDSEFYVPSTEYVTPTSANVQAAFQPVVVRP